MVHAFVFLYGTLNTALREGDVNTLIAFRSFILDLTEQLTREYEKYRASFSENINPIISVYRGQNITLNELNYMRRNPQQFLSIRSFLSTSLDRDYAKLFAQSSDLPSTGEIQRVLFQFDINTRIENSKPYASIKHLSDFSNEDEVLIGLGAIFRIIQIEFDERDQIWNAVLSLCSDDQYELKGLMLQVKEDVGDRITSLGYWLCKVGEFEKARSWFQWLLLNPLLDLDNRLHCYSGLGHVALALGDLDEALVNFEKELEICMEWCEDKSIAMTKVSISEVYLWKKKYDLALSYGQEAVNILLPSNHSRLLKAYLVIAQVYQHKTEFKLASEYYEKALDVGGKHFPENHEQFAVTYANMGTTYRYAGNYVKAIEYSKKAERIFRKCLLPNRPDISTIEGNIRSVEALLTCIKKPC
ncbi:hypothetical protein I4U23_017016 [Adineta vaga]|nr:hypothetical protein I4U23_017016 [Adineta vaga]